MSAETVNDPFPDDLYRLYLDGLRAESQKPQPPITVLELARKRACRRKHLLQAVGEANAFFRQLSGEDNTVEPFSLTERPGYTGVTIPGLGRSQFVKKYEIPFNKSVTIKRG